MESFHRTVGPKYLAFPFHHLTKLLPSSHSSNKLFLFRAIAQINCHEAQSREEHEPNLLAASHLPLSLPRSPSQNPQRRPSANHGRNHATARDVAIAPHVTAPIKTKRKTPLRPGTPRFQRKDLRENAPGHLVTQPGRTPVPSRIGRPDRTLRLYVTYADFSSSICAPFLSLWR